MLEINIPGFGRLVLTHLVADFNGTLALDGRLLPGVKEALNRIAETLEVHILTADTFGRARTELEGINCELHIYSGEQTAEQKVEYVQMLGSENVAALGNGRNDIEMLEAARIGIAVAGDEGCSPGALLAADIHVKSVHDAFGLLLNPDRCKSTLRS